MPELPEVETIRRGIEPRVLGRAIERVRVRDARLRWPVPASLPRQLRGQRIASTGRRGKYLLLGLDSGDRIIIHLGMSGQLTLHEPGHPLRKHDHVDFELSGDVLLRFRDPRRFGAVLIWPRAEATHPLLSDLGPEPFSAEFDGAYLFQRSRGRVVAVKNFIMDGHVVVGAGNIYASEALFRAGIRPSRAAGKLTGAQCIVLASKIREVLAEAVQQGGTTLRDYRNSSGESGYFQVALNVYGRDGEPCHACGTAVRRLVLGQRASFYCPRCQT